MNQQVAEDEIDIRALLAVLLTHWKLIISMLLLGLAAGVFYAQTATPIYRSNALIQVDKKSQGITALGAEVSDLLQMDASSAQTEIELIKSRMVLWPVIDSLHLDTHLKPVADSWVEKLPHLKNNQVIHTAAGVGSVNGNAWISRFNVPKAYYGKTFTLTSLNTQDYQLTTDDGIQLKGKVNAPLSFATPSGTIELLVKALPLGQSYYLSQQQPSVAIDTLKSKLAVAEQGKQTGILFATLDGVNQDEITQTLTKIVQTYEQQNEARSTAETSKTLAFMQEQLPKLQAKLSEAETAFNQFRQQNGTVDIDKEAVLTIEERGKIQATLRELELKRAELSERYTDEYPVLKQINAQIDKLRANETALNSNITRIPNVQRQFLELSNDVKISSEIYLTMLKNYEQLQIAKAGQMGYVRIVDLPISTYQPIAPKKSQIVLLATLLGLMLGVGLAFLKSLFNSGIKDVDTLEAQTDVPVIGVIPHSARAQKLQRKKSGKMPLLEYIEPDGIANESIKSLRTHLLLTLKGNNSNRIMISSAGPGVGKSFLGANLAVALAMAGKRVLLIDADARLGHLQQYFGRPNTYGLVDYLTDTHIATDGALPADLVQRTGIDNLDLIPRGRYHKNSSELFLNGRLQHFLDTIQTHYDFILLDTSPVMGTSDALAIGQLANMVLFITRYGVSTVKQVDFAIERLTRAQIPVQGIVFNDTQQSLIDNYNYHYGYSYKAKQS